MIGKDRKVFLVIKNKNKKKLIIRKLRSRIIREMSLKEWIEKIKKLIKNKSAYAGIALVVSFYFLGKASKAQSIPKVKLSHFLLALS